MLDLATPQAVRAGFAAWMLDVRGWTRETRRTRLATMEHARRFFADRDTTLLGATREDVLAFISSRHPRTRNRKLTDLRAFYVFAVETGYARTDPTAGLRRLREPRNLPRPLTREQAHRLLVGAALVSDRAYAIVALLLYTGIRREEAVSLPWSYVDLEDRRARIFGKGSKERIVPLAPDVIDVLRGWTLRTNGSPWVFPSEQRPGMAISRETLWRDVTEAAAAGGLDGISPHRLRHTLATLLLDEGADIRVVQEILGHASLKSTQIYTEVSVTRLDEHIGRIHYEGLR